MSELAAPQSPPGYLMRAEASEAAEVFARGVLRETPALRRGFDAIYFLARGSSDAAACMLMHECMARLGVPTTRLPLSAFSLLGGVAMRRALALAISQSGESDDLARSVEIARRTGGFAAAILNEEDSPVGRRADLIIPAGAGPERAVPATKSVLGSVAAGMALLAALEPNYRKRCEAAADAFRYAGAKAHPQAAELRATLSGARSAYVVGRGAGYGAAMEIALKLKETCAIHAEAHSASEALHGPLQLATGSLVVLILDIGDDAARASLDAAEVRFREAGSAPIRLRLAELTGRAIAPPAAAALLLNAIYPAILETSLALGLDPDAPSALRKVTRTL